MENALMLDKLLSKPGIGNRLLALYPDMVTLAQNLDTAPITQAQREKLRVAFGLRLVCEDRPRMRDRLDVVTYVKDLALEPCEHFVVLCLNTRYKVVYRDNLYRGNIHTQAIRIAEVFRYAVANNIAAIVVVHNHPSGDPTPSLADIEVTKHITQAGKILDIEVLDHVIIAAGDGTQFVSMKEKCLMG